MFEDDDEKESWDNTDLNIEDTDQEDDAISWDDLLSENGDAAIEEHVNKHAVNDVQDAAVNSDEDEIVINLDDETSLEHLANWNLNDEAQSAEPAIETSNAQAQTEDLLDLYNDETSDEADINAEDLLNDNDESIQNVNVQDNDENSDVEIKVKESTFEDDISQDEIKNNFLNLVQSRKSIMTGVAAFALAVIVVSFAVFGFSKMSKKGDVAQKPPEVAVEEGIMPADEAMPVSEEAMQEYTPEALDMGIQQQQKQQKTIIDVVSTGRANPFTPAGNFSVAGYTVPSAVDVIAPPNELIDDPSLSGLVDIQVSGILYDNYKPSAIVTIGGVDHFVQKGDVVDKYIVNTITPTNVVIRNGKNLFSASIGQKFNINEDIKGQTKYVYNKNKTYTRQYFTPVDDAQDANAGGGGQTNVPNVQIQ